MVKMIDLDFWVSGPRESYTSDVGEYYEINLILRLVDAAYCAG